MFFMRKMATRQKLLLITMATSVTALILTGTAFIAWEQVTLRRSMIRGFSMQAKMLADNCKAALAFEDVEDAKEMLSSLHVESSIVYGGVYSTNKEIFADYYRADVNSDVRPLEIRESGYGFGDGFLTIFEPVILDGEEIGTVCVRSDLSPMYMMLRRNTGIIVVVLIFAFLASYFMSARLQKIISEPILGLAKVAGVVSEKKDYSIRAQKHNDDEVGFLIDSFNEMLEQIQRHNLELSRANNQLAMQVEERKRTEKALELLNCDLELTVGKLDESNRELQHFAYIASHDLREPLRKISSFGGLLRDSLGGQLQEDDQENLDFMVNGAERMSQMIEGLLTYSRVSTKGKPLETVDLNKIVEQIEQVELAIMLEETNSTIEILEPLPKVMADPIQIRQLLQNIIANGIKYRQDGTQPRIVITTRQTSDQRARIEVQDNGIGIKKEFYEDVFTMFRRLHSRQKYDGAGIGLAVCKKIIDRHQGQIGVESEYGEGSRFWFTLALVSETVGAVVEG